MLFATRAPNRALLVAGFIVAALLATLFMPVSGAEAAKITTCVNKKTGKMKLVSGKKAKKKCRKGWKKVSWNSRGPAGPQLKLVAKNGDVVGKFRGSFPASAPIYMVQRGNGQFIYYGSGELYPTGSPKYTAPDCSGNAYISSSSGIGVINRLLRLFGGPFRYVFRADSGVVLGPASAWKSTGTFQSVIAVQTYERDSSSGVCVAAGGVFSGELILLKPVSAPPDFVGPLRVK